MKTGLSKKVKIITAVACVLVTLAFLCVYSYGAFEISQINRNSNLTEELLQKKKSLDIQKYELLPSEEMGSGDYYLHESGCHRIYLSPYPDVAFFSSRVTAISIEEGCVCDVLGIKIGSSAREIYKILDSYGYKLLRGSDDFIVAEKRRVKITIKLNKAGNAQTVIVSLETTNIGGVNF